MRSRLQAVALALLLPVIAGMSECKSPPPIAVNSYCEIKGTELIDMTDAGLQRLTPKNQGAVLAGDDNYKRECLLGDRKNSGGPR